MIQIPAGSRCDAPPLEVVGPMGVQTLLHHLRANDVFEFIHESAPQFGGEPKRLPAGRLRVSIQPWGPKTKEAGPIGPWMFACRDEIGIEHHFALSPRLDVRLLERRRKS